MTSNQQQTEALHRAQTQSSRINEAIVVNEFAGRGITATPRIDVFTYGAWRAKGRQVQKGEKGVKLTTWIVCKKKGASESDPDSKYKRPKTVAVFHISQTATIQ